MAHDSCQGSPKRRPPSPPKAMAGGGLNRGGQQRRRRLANRAGGGQRYLDLAAEGSGDGHEDDDYDELSDAREGSNLGGFINDDGADEDGAESAGGAHAALDMERELLGGGSQSHNSELEGLNGQSVGHVHRGSRDGDSERMGDDFSDFSNDDALGDDASLTEALKPMSQTFLNSERMMGSDPDSSVTTSLYNALQARATVLESHKKGCYSIMMHIAELLDTASPTGVMAFSEYLNQNTSSEWRFGPVVRGAMDENGGFDVLAARNAITDKILRFAKTESGDSGGWNLKVFGDAIVRPLDSVWGVIQNLKIQLKQVQDLEMDKRMRSGMREGWNTNLAGLRDLLHLYECRIRAEVDIIKQDVLLVLTEMGNVKMDNEVGELKKIEAALRLYQGCQLPSANMQLSNSDSLIESVMQTQGFYLLHGSSEFVWTMTEHGIMQPTYTLEGSPGVGECFTSSAVTLSGERDLPLFTKLLLDHFTPLYAHLRGRGGDVPVKLLARSIPVFRQDWHRFAIVRPPSEGDVVSEVPGGRDFRRERRIRLMRPPVPAGTRVWMWDAEGLRWWESTPSDDPDNVTPEETVQPCNIIINPGFDPAVFDLVPPDPRVGNPQWCQDAFRNGAWKQISTRAYDRIAASQGREFPLEYFYSLGVGRAMLPGLHAEVATYYIGLPGTGKSRAIEGLADVLGTGDGGVVTIDSGNNNQFSNDQLRIRKHVRGVQIGEFNEGTKVKQDDLAGWCHNERVQVQAKNRDSFMTEFPPVFLAGNSSPLAELQCGAGKLDRRLVIFEFGRKIDDMTAMESKEMSRLVREDAANLVIKGSIAYRTHRGGWATMAPDKSVQANGYPMYFKRNLQIFGSKSNKSSMFLHRTFQCFLLFDRDYLEWCLEKGPRLPSPRGASTQSTLLAPFHERYRMPFDSGFAEDPGEEAGGDGDDTVVVATQGGRTVFDLNNSTHINHLKLAMKIRTRGRNEGRIDYSQAHATGFVMDEEDVRKALEREKQNNVTFKTSKTGVEECMKQLEKLAGDDDSPIQLVGGGGGRKKGFFPLCKIAVDDAYDHREGGGGYQFM